MMILKGKNSREPSALRAAATGSCGGCPPVRRRRVEVKGVKGVGDAKTQAENPNFDRFNTAFEITCF
jgi:hypothetical protein